MLPAPRPYFADLSDPRRETRNKLHKLSDIIMLVFWAVLSGMEAWVGMEALAQPRDSWFRRFLELPTGIPAPDTLRACTITNPLIDKHLSVLAIFKLRVADTL